MQQPEEKIICVKWQPATAEAPAYHFYHEECYAKMPVILPEMEKFSLSKEQMPVPFISCSICGIDIEL